MHGGPNKRQTDRLYRGWSGVEKKDCGGGGGDGEGGTRRAPGIFRAQTRGLFGRQAQDSGAVAMTGRGKGGVPKRVLKLR